MKNKSEIPKEGHTRVQWAIAISVSMTILTYGLQCGWVSPVTKILQSSESPVGRPLTDTEISLVAGIPSLSAIISILTLVYVVDKFGRKYAIWLMTSFQLVSWIITIYSSSPAILIIARVFCGLGAGGCFHIIPMYIKEISQNDIRGTLGSIVTLAHNIGILTMYALGGYCDYNTVLYLVVGLPVLAMLLLIKAPESPPFLVKIGKLEEAATTIAFVRGLDVSNKRVQAEIDSIKKEDDYFNSIPNVSFLKIFKDKAWRRGFTIMVIIIIIHALSGAFAIINYASIILADSNLTISPELQSLAVPIFLTIGTAITMATVDKLGRRPLLASTFILTSLSYFGLASSMLLRDYGWATPGWLPIVVILLAVCSYGVGISPVPFILMPEIFNFQIRAKLMACLCILAWFTSFIQLTAFTSISSAFGVHTSFFMFSGINLLGAVVVLTLLPETRGKSVEEIERKLRKEKRSERKMGE